MIGLIDNIFFLILGFILIIKAADVLVDSASSIALKFKVPKMLIALTIVSFGTCAPEIAISFTSISSKNGMMALANVIGSCVVNVLLIIGLSAFIHPIKIKNSTIKKELPLLLIITTGFAVMILDTLFNPTTSDILSRADGIILMLMFSMFVIYLIKMVRSRKEESQEEVPTKYNIWLSCFFLIVSILVIVFSSDLIVNNAISLAEALNISEKIVTMVAIVIGTSLPELVMTVTAAKKNEFEMAIGNIIGTNIFNICIVLGLPIAIFGDLKLINFNIIDILALFLSSGLLYVFAKSEKEISKKEGIIMILVFIIYYIYLFIGA